MHYLWKFQKFSNWNLKTTEGEFLEILKVGTHNKENEGPDFFTSQIIIDNQKWAGNVEVHVKSSDWYSHNHQTDTNYDSVILHVVWQEDVAVFRRNNTKIPTLELKKYIDVKQLDNYKRLFSNLNLKEINCENDIASVDDFVWKNWLERLYFERLEEKSIPILELLERNNNNWEATCFCIIAKAFGSNKNGNAFFKMAESIPFSIVQKEVSAFRLEALFMGQCNMLKDEGDNYMKKLYDEYNYLKKKYSLEPIKETVQFFRLRPSNFPTIRLSQLAMLYANKINLFQLIVEATDSKELQKLIKTSTSEYWFDHYNFYIKSKTSSKKIISPLFFKTILLNAIIPLRFIKRKVEDSNMNFSRELLIIETLSPESNSITAYFKSKGVVLTSSLHSQALLTLKNNYCKLNKCLQCNIGSFILKYE